MNVDRFSFPLQLNQAIQTRVFQTPCYFKLKPFSLDFPISQLLPTILNLHYFEHRVKKKQDSTVFHVILLSRPMDFLECDPPVDFTANETAREESGYGCTRVSSYNLH